MLPLPGLQPDGAHAQGKAGVDPLVLAGKADLVGATGCVPGGERLHHFQLAAACLSCALLGNRQTGGDGYDDGSMVFAASDPSNRLVDTRVNIYTMRGDRGRRPDILAQQHTQKKKTGRQCFA